MRLKKSLQITNHKKKSLTHLISFSFDPEFQATIHWDDLDVDGFLKSELQKELSNTWTIILSQNQKSMLVSNKAQ